jgi:hypothetical protein
MTKRYDLKKALRESSSEREDRAAVEKLVAGLGQAEAVDVVLSWISWAKARRKRIGETYDRATDDPGLYDEPDALEEKIKSLRAILTEMWPAARHARGRRLLWPTGAA